MGIEIMCSKRGNRFMVVIRDSGHRCGIPSQFGVAHEV